jgi:ribosome maturation factor RimP
MIDKKTVKDLCEGFVADKELFLVDVKISTANRITIMADKPEGITIDECVMISRHIEANLDREKEDYELKVSSPGLDLPFKVAEQYKMNIGREVEVIDKEGKRFKGKLSNAEGQGFEIISEKKSKGKKKETTELSFNYDDVIKVRLIIKFK